MDFLLFESRPGVAAAILPDAPRFTVVAVTHDFLRSVDMKREDVVGKGHFEPFPESPEDGAFSGENNIRAAFEYVVQHKKPYELALQRYDIPNGDGTFTERYWKPQGSPVLNELGELLYIIHAPVEVTEKVHADKVAQAHQELKSHFQQLEESEHRFRTLIEESTVANALYLGRELVVQYANDIMIGYWGKDKTMIGQPLSAAVPELKGQPFFGYLDRVYTTGEPYIGKEEKAMILVNGGLQPFYFNFTCKALRDLDGNIYGIHNIAIDVTNEVLSRRRLEENRQESQLAIDAADLGTFRLDLLTNQAINSEKVNEWFGYTVQGYSREEGFNPIHPEDRSYVDEVILPTLQSEANSSHDVTYRVVHPNTGTVRHLRSFGKTMFNDGGKPYLIIGIIQDVTTQILHQQHLKNNEALLQQRVLERTLELEKANGDLKRSNQNLEEFAYAASHDMKEPIRKIHFFADRIKARLVNKMEAEDLRYFERLESGTKRMSTLIDDLLLYSHVNRGINLVETVDLNQMLSFVMEDLELHIQEKAAQVEIGPLPTIQGRPRQLQQLFENLIANAIKYGKEGVAPVVSVTARLINGADTGVHATAVNKDKMYHLIEVRDNGIGFEQTDAERIFNVFTRLHGNAEYRGTGVGLSIAQKIVENHDGHIWAESTPGEGATFYVLLPAAA